MQLNTRGNMVFAAGVIATAIILSACVPEPVPPTQKLPRSDPDMVMADDIPIAHTPPGGYGNTFPPPVLAACTEPLVAGAPDLRGIWKTLRAQRRGEPVPEGERIYHYVERIEQCPTRSCGQFYRGKRVGRLEEV